MDYGVSTDNVLVNGTSTPGQDFNRLVHKKFVRKEVVITFLILKLVTNIILSLLLCNRMCRDILEDKNIKLDKMNNINLGSSGQMVTNLGPGADLDTGHQLTSGGHASNQLTSGGHPSHQLTSGGHQLHTGQRLPERVVEMYNMLIGITTELEKIKYELAKSK